MFNVQSSSIFDTKGYDQPLALLYRSAIFTIVVLQFRGVPAPLCHLHYAVVKCRGIVSPLVVRGAAMLAIIVTLPPSKLHKRLG